jgi:hypothetical protein
MQHVAGHVASMVGECSRQVADMPQLLAPVVPWLAHTWPCIRHG